jgi:hypothetical protein
MQASPLKISISNHFKSVIHMSRKKKEENESLSEFQDVEKTGRNEIVLNSDQLSRGLKKLLKKDAEGNERAYVIKDATIKDDFCNYGYEIKSGIGIGDTHNVKGSGIIDNDLREALGVFNVHLAAIDDAFKFSKYEIEDIDKEHVHELTGLYSVTGFKMSGTEEAESIILIGSKYVSAGGRIKLETPKIPLDSASSYKWYNELKAAADTAREEVALYKEGKCTPPEEEETDGPLKQTTIKFAPPEGEQSGEGAQDQSGQEVDSDFAEAAL